jgi:intracellular sulfur oxidation DsrE/DsrF family protein
MNVSFNQVSYQKKYMKRSILVMAIFLYCINCIAQVSNTDSLKLKKDSTLRAMLHNDSLKVEKEFAEAARWEKIKAQATFPLIKGGTFSGTIPVSNATELPDPKMDYKLLFELTFKNPDSVATELNYALVETARILNLHIAAGIAANKLKPVIIVHAGALNAITNNDYHNKHFKIPNPNLAIIKDLEKAGAKMIACGQAMAFLDIKKEELLPEVKVAYSAKTTISTYQLKGYVLYTDSEIGK